MAIRVAVVGAGGLGLMALKNLKEDGFDVTVYESRAYVGGIWRPSDDDALSALDNTVFNSSRYRSAIPDFPFPDDTDDFPTSEQILRYLESYCKHFDLNRHIHLETRVKSIARKHDQWAVDVEQSGSGPRTDHFDKIVIATGTFISPRVPTLDAIEMFKGPVIHSLNYHQPGQFKGNNVLLIGLHATSQDVVVSLAKHAAAKVYVAHKSGLIMMSKYVANGTAYDQTGSLNFTHVHVWLSEHFPNLTVRLIDWVIGSMSKKSYPNIPAKWNFSPAPSVSTTAPLIADEIYPYLEDGFAEPVSAVRRITGPKQVELSDGRILTDIDAIIYCTGYDTQVPFLPPEYNPYPVVGEAPHLYRHMFLFSPDPAIRNSIAFIGHGAIPFPGYAQFEAQAQAVSQIWLGNSSLPPHLEMEKWYENYLIWRHNTVAKQKVKASFYALWLPMPDYMKWLDETAGLGLFEHFGWFSKRAWELWWRDRELYYKCLNGLFTPTIWRLFDVGKRKAWPGAREQIFRDNKLAEEQVKRRQEWMRTQKQQEEEKRSKLGR